MAKDTTNNAEKQPVGIRLDNEMLNLIGDVMKEEGRPSIANTIERLLKTHPRIAPLLKGQTQGAA